MEKIAERANPILDFAPILRIRRNHGLEHATVHMLQRKFKDLKVSGWSSPFGFVLLHNAPADMMETAAHDALKRMKKGEAELAVHPNCGTNLITTGVLTTLVGVLFLWRHRLTGARLQRALFFMILALMAGQPLGMSIQRNFTTEGDPGDMEIHNVFTSEIRFPSWGKKVSVTMVWTSTG
jgi:hypothetical protein